FAGDAVLAVWPAAEDAGLRPAARQAAQAALEVQRDLNNLELAPGVRLSLRICLGAGDLSTALVGGKQGFWQLVGWGPPLDQIREARELAAVGKVHPSTDARAHLHAGAEGEPLPGVGAPPRRPAAGPPAPRHSPGPPA